MEPAADKGQGFRPVCLSLADVAGHEYTAAVCGARATLTGEPLEQLQALAAEPVEFFPASMQERIRELLPRVGERCCPPLTETPAGATSAQFAVHSKPAAAPLSGFGPYRIGEDGRLFLISKSEHYHAPLGHSFPGYGLLTTATRLGIPNATHNNTRGAITRRLEEELVRVATGLATADIEAQPGTSGDASRGMAARPAGTRAIQLADAAAGGAPASSQALSLARTASIGPHGGTAARGLDRVLNLETGSLAAEAALKLVLARFYRIQEDSPEPEYHGRAPVLLVLGDDDGGLCANYHGTTILAQGLRGMWPDLVTGLAGGRLLRIQPVRPNRVEDLEAAFAMDGRDGSRIAGAWLELVMMNYGARRLDEEFVVRLQQLADAHDVPIVVDEIQTCLWSPRLFMFHEYGLRPGFAVIGKGMPGGQYAASRVLFAARYDSLPQFGALVTNGQEELAALAYLVTLRWAEANAAVTARHGEAYEQGLRGLARRFPAVVRGIEGRRHLAGIAFDDLTIGKRLCARLNEMGLDISVQAYKADCPPVALTKLPLIAGPEVIDAVLQRLHSALAEL